jgi:hypothetical protein
LGRGAERGSRQLKELRFLEGVDDVEWVGVSPSQSFVPGEATAADLGGEELLDGSSQLSTGTMSVCDTR